MPERTAHRRTLVVLVLLIVVAILVAGSAPLHRVSERVVSALASLIADHPTLGVVAFVSLAALSAMLAFVSSVVLVPVAVHQWGSTVTVLLLWVSWLAGGIGGYVIGRYLGGPAVRRLAGAARLRHFEERISASAPIWLVFLFQLALQSEIPAYVLGTVRYPLFKYLLALGAAELPIAIAAVMLGTGFLNRQYWLMAGVGLAGVAVVGLAIVVLHRHLSSTPHPGEAPPPV
jgi:uncharacterized membrane protein YdjX (TVP38/TMEM64 family)